jgi:TIR domain
MHIFLSYARADEEIVQRLSSVFRAVGIHPWVDVGGLPPGTPQWDAAIRDALRDARAVIAFCSEKSRDSHYVAIELEIAKGYQKKIFPVWVSGENWSQSAPLALVLSQYIDLRPPRRREGITSLIHTQKQHLASLPTDDKWPFVRVEWKDKYFYLNPFLHNDWGALLSQVYLTLLKDDFAAFSYGQTWALNIAPRHVSPSRRASVYPYLALPASWAAVPFKAVHKVDPTWISSAADLEFASIIKLYRDFVVRSSMQVLDLRTLSTDANVGDVHKVWHKRLPARNFVGFRCRWMTFCLFASGFHSKTIASMHMSTLRTLVTDDEFFKILEGAQLKVPDECSQAFDYFEMSEPRFQGVMLRSSYLEPLMPRIKQSEISPFAKFIKSVANIVKFKSGATIIEFN